MHKNRAAVNQQTVTTLRNGRVERLQLPAADVEIMPGVLWGRFDEFFTPAFWVSRFWIDGDESKFTSYSIGRSLKEEVAACLLGGYGMPAEVGLAAFARLRDRGLLNGEGVGANIELALIEPFLINGRKVKYRFPRTKASFVAGAMRRLNSEKAPTGSGKMLRDWLLTFPGIGPKTASWIARNAVGANDVAILDVHVIRAGMLMGLFSVRHSVQRDYFVMEAKLINFAHAVGMQLSRFDSMIWCYMRQLNLMALEALAVAKAGGKCA